MGACWRAWFVMHRAEEKIIPADNPFSKMALKKLTPSERRRETPTATWDELQIYRAEATRLGCGSLATTALTRGGGCSVRSICSARSRSPTIGRKNGRTASASYIRRPARQPGGRCSTRPERRCFPN